MMHEMYRQIVTKLRKENKSFTEIGNIIGLYLHAVRSLYVYKRKTHSKKRGRKFLLQNKDKLNIKRRISILNSTNQSVNATKIKVEYNLDMSTRTITRTLRQHWYGVQKHPNKDIFNKSPYGKNSCINRKVNNN